MFISHLLPKLFIPGESSVQREKIEKNENLKLLPKFIVNMETLKAAALPSFYCLTWLSLPKITTKIWRVNWEGSTWQKVMQVCTMYNMYTDYSRYV